MKKTTKIWLCVAGVCIAVGILFTVIGILTGGSKGFSVNSNGKVVFNHEMVDETSDSYTGIEKIKVDVDNYAINVVESDSNEFYVSYNYQNDEDRPAITKDGSTLSVEESGDHTWSWFSFDLSNWGEDFLMTIYVPKNTSLDELSLITKNGTIEIQYGLNTDTLYAKSSNGRITLQDVKVSKSTTLKTSNGRIECDGTFAGETSMDTSNGKIICTGTYSGETDLDTSNGKIEFEGDATGEFKAESSNGSITVALGKSKESYDFEARTSNGHVYVDGQKEDDHYTETHSSANSLTLKTSNGSIHMDFDK